MPTLLEAFRTGTDPLAWPPDFVGFTVEVPLAAVCDTGLAIFALIGGLGLEDDEDDELGVAAAAARELDALVLLRYRAATALPSTTRQQHAHLRLFVRAEPADSPAGFLP